MPKKEIRLTRNNITEIEEAFDKNFHGMLTAFYNVDDKKIQMLAERRRDRIISTAREILDKDGDEVSLEDSQQLIALIKEFKDESVSEKEIQNIQDQVTQNLEQSTTQLLRLVDRFSTHVFRYNSTDRKHFAPQLIDLLDNEDEVKKAFITLEESSQEARRKLAAGEKIEPELYETLKNSYNRVVEADFVQSAAKTNYLKNSGFHAKNIARNLIVVGALFSLAGLIPVGGAPTAAPSFQAVMGFVLAQALPIAAVAGALTVGGTYSRSLINNRRLNRVREQIRTIENKEQLFELISKHAPTKDKGARQSRKAFCEEAKKLGFNINLGRGPGATRNFLFLVEADQFMRDNPDFDSKFKRINKKLRKIEDRRKAIPEKPNNEATKQRILEKQFLSDNPICEVLGIRGTVPAPALAKKAKPKATATATENKPQISQPEAQPTKRASSSKVKLDGVETALRNPSITTAPIEISIRRSKFLIELSKASGALEEARVIEALNGLQQYLENAPLAKGKTAELEFTNGKKKKTTIKVTKQNTQNLGTVIGQKKK